MGNGSKIEMLDPTCNNLTFLPDNLTVFDTTVSNNKYFSFILDWEENVKYFLLFVFLFKTFFFLLQDNNVYEFIKIKSKIQKNSKVINWIQNL